MFLNNTTTKKQLRYPTWILDLEQCKLLKLRNQQNGKNKGEVPKGFELKRLVTTIFRKEKFLQFLNL